MELIDHTLLTWRLQDGVGRIVLASSATANALGVRMLGTLSSALRRLTADAACRAIVIRAEGGTFSSGFDLSEAASSVSANDATAARLFADCLLRITEAPQAVVAAVQGKALGGAVGLLAACDIVIAAEDAILQLPEVVAGMIPAIVTPFLLRRVPPAKARYLAISSRGLAARDGYSCGLIDEIAPVDGVGDAVERQVQRILRSSPRAIAEYKRGLSAIAAADLRGQADEAVEWLARWLANPATGADIAEFANGFAPSWFGAPRGRNG